MPVPKTPLSNSQVKKTEKETMKKTPKSKSTKTPSKVETPVKQEKKTPKSSKKASKENLTPAPGDKSKFQTPKKSGSKNIKSKDKAEGGIILQHNDQLPDKAALSHFVKALLQVDKKVTESKSGGKQQLFDEDGIPISLQINGIKLPRDDRKQILKIRLPNCVIQPPRDTCLIVKDLKKGLREDHEDSVNHFKDLLEDNGVSTDMVTEVISLRQLKVEYKQYESKLSLVKKFDVFLADTRILRLLPKFLGKPFYARKKFPVPISLDPKNLKEEVERGIHTVTLPLSHHGTTSRVVFGNTAMSQKDIAENLATLLEVVGKRYPGGIPNIRSLHIKTEVSPAVPIHLNTASGNGLGYVDASLPAKATRETVTGELSTQPGMEVTVTPYGTIKVKKTGDPLWDDEKDEPFVSGSEEENDEAEEEEEPKKEKKKKEEVSKKRKSETEKDNKKSKKAKKAAAKASDSEEDSEAEDIKESEDAYLKRTHKEETAEENDSKKKKKSSESNSKKGTGAKQVEEKESKDEKSVKNNKKANQVKEKSDKKQEEDEDDEWEDAESSGDEGDDKDANSSGEEEEEEDEVSELEFTDGSDDEDDEDSDGGSSDDDDDERIQEVYDDEQELDEKDVIVDSDGSEDEDEGDESEGEDRIMINPKLKAKNEAASEEDEEEEVSNQKKAKKLSKNERRKNRKEGKSSAPTTKPGKQQAKKGSGNDKKTGGNKKPVPVKPPKGKKR